MSNIGNKKIMAKNLKYYIDKSGKDRKQLAELWGFPYSTVTEWVNGKKYPRIDRIEIMADYFGILKSDLIEEKTPEMIKMQERNDKLADMVIRMRGNENYFNICEVLYDLEDDKLLELENFVNKFIK